MKIIISELQYKFLISESKFEEERQEIINNIEKYGIEDVAESMGITSNKLIDKFNIPFDDEKVKELIKYYIDEKMDKVYDFEPKTFYCSHYINPKTFLNVVEEGILEFLYYDYYVEFLDDDSLEFYNVAYLVSNYIDKKYGKLIKDKFIEYCKNINENRK
jgi:hypothetical protein